MLLLLRDISMSKDFHRLLGIVVRLTGRHNMCTCDRKHAVGHHEFSPCSLVSSPSFLSHTLPPPPKSSKSLQMENQGKTSCFHSYNAVSRPRGYARNCMLLIYYYSPGGKPASESGGRLLTAEFCPWLTQDELLPLGEDGSSL